MSQYRIEAGTGQHIGDRAEQQDRVALFGAPKAPGYLMAGLADGMGGKPGGAMAAEQVVQTARHSFETFSPVTDGVEALLTTIAKEAHTVIRLSALSTEKEPHSTMVALVLTPGGEAVWAHVGDSRLYRFEGPNCVGRTIDHSYVEKLLAEGRIAREEARRHRLAHVLTNALGARRTEPAISIDRCGALKAGDAFLLCSDGVWQYLSEVEMGAAIAMNRPRDAAEMLIGKARGRARGSQGDNCTLAVVKLVPPVEAPKSYAAQKMRRAV
ncbi:MAG: PP2C family protein-serine/threonine phosphatase [Burkholderiaceae bacterium]